MFFEAGSAFHSRSKIKEEMCANKTDQSEIKEKKSAKNVVRELKDLEFSFPRQ